ncbi:retrovirus-related pol polyprotein from transposon TNT 1-94 [Tanacetum coccineum]
MVPRAVLMKSSLVSINTTRQNTTKPTVLVNTARQVKTAHTRKTVNDARPMVNTIRGNNVNTASPKVVVNAVKGRMVNAVKASACWDKGVIDSGGSKHMTGNMSYLTDYEEIDGGYVAFGRNPKGGKITGKGAIKTGNLDFENVYFVRELKFNLFSVSQICDKKNSVLFNDTKCIVLSPNFKLIDESQVLLKVPRKNNMYSVDLKNIVPKGGLTFLFAKSTSNESKLCHRRLGHLNFKTMNKLVKGNLVRVYLLNFLKIIKHVLLVKKESSTEPLDETSAILKSFITRIENLVDHKVKVTRNSILIEAARTMLADCKLPTTFWAEAVNTACYVQNRVLVVKPHNKTPYELFHGRTPTLSFMRPFGCLVTILNTKDHLGKFDGKTDEGFFVRYSLNSKSFRVFNIRTRIVEENLHFRFSESAPNVVGSRLDWLFDIDALTRTINFEPIVAGTHSKEFLDDEVKPSSDDGKKVNEDPGKEDEVHDQEKNDDVNSTNKVNTVSSTVNTAGINELNAISSDEFPDDPDMPTLEEIDYLSDDEDVGVEADMNNLNITIPVSPIPTTRIHKDHPLNQVIRDLQSATQIRKMLKNLEEHGAIGTKWIFKNKKDERGIMIRNKARLVAQGHTQEERIDYDEVFAPVTKIEAIRLFLAYASFKDFMVYQMDVKSAFLYGKIKEEVLHQGPRAWYETLLTYLLDNGFQRGKFDKTLFIKRYKGDILLVQVYVDDVIFGSTKKELCTKFERLMHEMFQMSSIGELTFFLGLKVKQKEDGIFISQDKYVAKILKKFGFTEVKTAKTPMETQKPLLKDKDGEEVDVHMYRYISHPKNVADLLTKVLIFSELNCKALADLGASTNLMPLLVWKKLGLSELISTRMTLELANRSVCTQAGIARDVFVPVWICQILQEISQKRTRERMSDQEAKEIKSRSQRDHASAFYSQLQLTHSQPKPTPLFYKVQGLTLQFMEVVYILKLV